MKKYKGAQSGFTLIEIMVVVVIIGLLAAFVLPGVVENQDVAFKKASKTKISQVTTSLALYKLDNFNYPSTAQGLQALVTNPGGEKNWTQKSKVFPKDAWENELQYQFPGVKNPKSFDLWSFGADGIAGGEGFNADIGNWEEE